MNKLSALFLILILHFVSCAGPGRKHMENDPAAHVNPFIGTGDFGHTFPGAAVPFGMVQLSPDMGNTDWRFCSGYHYADSTIMGFSHTHLSGTGVPDLGDFLVMPFIEPAGSPEREKKTPPAGPASRFLHLEESASPGYYSVMLKDFQIKAELTVSPRAGFHRYTFPKSERSSILIDLFHTLNYPGEGNRILASHCRVVNDTLITGFHRSQGWARDRTLFFAAVLSKPAEGIRLWVDGTNPENGREGSGREVKLVLKYSTAENERILIKVGISAVSAEGALNNVLAEIPHWDFDSVKRQAWDSWNEELNKISILADEKTKKIFYTSLYHAFLSPCLYMDADRKYRGADLAVHTAGDFTNYHVFSLWDTHRALHPLFTIVQSGKVDDMINSMLAHQRQSADGILPIWSLGNNETYCMIGNHAVPVIVDAWLKGFRGFDADLAYEAIRSTLTTPHFNSNWDAYEKYGYLPNDVERTESVSKTLEFCLDDWCAARMAESLDRPEDRRFFMKRSEFYRNLFDPATRFMRAKDVHGKWIEPFHSLRISHASTNGGEYTEGNAWQYTWHVPQDVSGLIRLFGGEEPFVAKLDSLFSIPSDKVSDGFSGDVSGLIGQYAHGNEPCHHVAYLYDYAGRPWKTQEKVNEIVRKMYRSEPDGLCGNDDCGQMSAWLVFTTLGFYPVNPTGGVYAVGRPFCREAVLEPADGRTFRITAKNYSHRNPYVKSVRLNGKALKEPFICHQDIENGGILEFEMCPNQSPWGSVTGKAAGSEFQKVDPFCP
jgi:predicted alpha-1,2-mannosidase